MNCPQCGARTEKDQRFCVKCGAALPPAPAEEKPVLDLSAYFDEPAEPAPQTQPEPLPASAPQPQPQPEPIGTEGENVPTAQKSEKGLNIALLICGTLAVAVITFVLILLLWPNGNRDPEPIVPDYDPVIVSAEPEIDGGTDPVIPSDEPFVIITPSPEPVTSPTPIPTSTPTLTPVPGSTAAPTQEPAPDSSTGYLLAESDSRYLTEDDLKNLTHEQLCFARNEIFARHGRIFQTPQIAAYFNAKTWYKGTVSAADFQESVFNQYERANVSFISAYEKKVYGGSYY